MARYRGPRTRVSRRFSEPIFGKSKALQKKNYPPGQHGRGRKRQSEYTIQLAEKQKAKYTYGVLERQFANLFKRAFRQPGVTGINLLRLLERRLDNMVYRLGVASSRRQARQLVSHCHITVNGEVVNIPSYTLREGDAIGVREKSKTLLAITENLSNEGLRRLPWVSWNATDMTGQITRIPERDEIPENIKEQLIIELYSK